MKYLKIILTVIAVLLAAHLFKPLVTNRVFAGGGAATDVNIVQVAGKNIWVPSSVSGGIPVVVKQCKRLINPIFPS